MPLYIPGHSNRNHGPSSTRERSRQGAPTTQKGAPNNVPNSSQCLTTDPKGGERPSLRRVFGILKLSKAGKQPSRPRENCAPHSPTLGLSRTQSLSRMPTLADDTRGNVTETVVRTTEELSHILPPLRSLSHSSSRQPQFPAITRHPDDEESDDPPQYAVVDPYPITGTEHSAL
jgi:hypothetical protein